MDPELSSKFTLSDHKTVSCFVKIFHRKSILCSSPRLHCKYNALKLVENGDSGIRPSVAEPEKNSVENSPIY
jgi:hypothetical protein